MQIQRHYSKAPITEAIIDLRVALPEGFSVDKLKNIHSYISDNFPTIEPFYKGEKRRQFGNFPGNAGRILIQPTRPV